MPPTRLFSMFGTDQERESRKVGEKKRQFYNHFSLTLFDLDRDRKKKGESSKRREEKRRPPLFSTSNEKGGKGEKKEVTRFNSSLYGHLSGGGRRGGVPGKGGKGRGKKEGRHPLYLILLTYIRRMRGRGEKKNEEKKKGRAGKGKNRGVNASSRSISQYPSF